ncbi:MAG: pentapeptide repeat-containing protein [Alphaproteobacteria bacterium]|nr:pentapeptide repeat-containing protein [Alphaproteobacteria bacterium]
MSLLDLLVAENVAEFNATRGERAKVDLFAADLAEKNLREVDLSGADVDKADLTGSDLTSAGLYKARMNGIDGTGMKLVDCLGARVKLREAWLDEADLSGSDFANADLSEAVVTKSRGQGTRLSAANLKQLDARGAVWEDADLTGAHMSKANFEGASLSRSDLTEAAGAEVVFEKARLDAVVASRARLPAAKFAGAVLAGARFDAANLAECDFTDADLTGADLTNANLTNAILKGAKLNGAVLAEAGLEGVDLSGVDLTDVDMTGLDPDVLNLSAAQREQVMIVGIPINPDARLKPAKPSVARNGALVAGVWENDDGEETMSIRWFARTEKGVVDGVVPVTSASLLARAAVAAGDGVDIVLVREKPSTITVERFRVGPDGKLAATSTVPLGYQPVVVPVLQNVDGKVRMWGLARRGPTLVVSVDSAEGLQPVSSKQLPTARGFLGRHYPFLACKGGVVMPCTASGVGAPLKRPEGFPGKHAAAVEADGRWLAVWVEPPEGREKGGIRCAWLGTRGEPEVEDVTNNGAVLSLDAYVYDGEVHLAWVELVGLGDTKAFVQVLPDGEPRPLELDDVDELVFAPGPGPQPVLVATTEEERSKIVTLAGKVLGVLEDTGE